MKAISPRTILSLAVAVVIGALLQNAFALQGHMNHALELLRSARSELNAASRDKGGHRTEAVNLIDRAIGQVKEGIAAGEEHGDGA
jgi:hypothetical protein